MFELDQLCKRVTEMFSEDPSAPSVLCSWIADKEHFYCSVVRYSESFGRGKQVVHKATGATSREAVVECAKAFGLEFVEAPVDGS